MPARDSVLGFCGWERGKGGRTSDCEDGVEICWVSLTEIESDCVDGSGGWGPGDLEGCADGNAGWEGGECERVLCCDKGREAEENCCGEHFVDYPVE